MPRKKEPEVSATSMLLELTNALRKTAISPSIAAYKPLPHQEKFHKSRAKGKLFIGGNRSGKTVGGGAEMVKRLTGLHERKDLPPPPIRGRAVGVDLLQGVEKIIIPEIKKWMPSQYLNNGKWEDSYDIKSRTLTLTNGSTLEFMSYEQEVEKFAGTSRHCIWFDEEPPLAVFNECLVRLVDTDGDWWITMTPLVEMSWTFDRIYEPSKENGPTEELEIFEVDTHENTHVKEAALERLLFAVDKSERDSRTKGTQINHTGLVYAETFKPDMHVMDDIVDSDDWPMYHAHWEHFIGFDHGWRNPTCFLFACANEEGTLIIYDEMYDDHVLVSEWAQRYHQRRNLLHIDPTYISGDPSIVNKNAITGTSVHTEYAEHNVYISLADNDIRGGITRVQHRFEKNLLYITRRCPKTLWELNRYRWDRYSSSKIAQRRSEKETPLKKDDHAMDSLRYLVVSRPALADEIDMPMRNVFNLPEASREGKDYDWAFSHDEYSDPVIDEFQGTEY